LPPNCFNGGAIFTFTAGEAPPRAVKWIWCLRSVVVCVCV
jgi:hypothetical protein